MSKERLYVFSDERVDRLQVEQPDAEIHMRSKEWIVLKVPGHNYWSARAEQSYAPAEFQIYRILGSQFDNAKRETIECEKIMDFPIRKHK